jgi:hypothetical protein
MKLWHADARALPVTLRPLGGETIPSYTRRLAEANDLRPTAIIRAIGEHPYSTGYHLLDRDAWINEQALDRLETYSGISRQRLQRALPALRWGAPGPQARPLPADRPAVHCYSPYPPARPACRSCVLRAARGSIPSPVLIRPAASSLICRRHQRWLDTRTEATQYDLSGTTEILTSHRRYRQLQASNADTQWVTGNLSTAWHITRLWADRTPARFPELRKRWHTRADRLGIPRSTRQPPVVTFPEAVTLAEILTDLNWRRHVAMAGDWQIDRFYQRVARRLEEPACRDLWGHDPIKEWADGHRRKFAATREKLWAAHWHSHQAPFPEIRHFK